MPDSLTNTTKLHAFSKSVMGLKGTFCETKNNERKLEKYANPDLKRSKVSQRIYICTNSTKSNHRYLQQVAMMWFKLLSMAKTLQQHKSCGLIGI